MENVNEVKFCVCAMIDLLGFSSHLELGQYDLRTEIGQQAIMRLENLEQIIFKLKNEEVLFEKYYPKNFEIQRVNDAIFLTLDLDEVLIPSIGETSFHGLSSENIDKYFIKENDKDWNDTNYIKKMNDAIEPLIQFLGIISRIHLFINKIEIEGHFSGAKTVISSGYRKPFVSKTLDKEDKFSANFAFANSYIAEQKLHGPNFYVDNGILQIISFNKYARNILKFGHYIFNKPPFSCFENYSDNFYIPLKPEITKSTHIELFRRDYIFKQINPSPLSYLQNLPSLLSFLDGTKEPNLSNIFFSHIFKAIKHGFPAKNENEYMPTYSFLFNGTNDLDKQIGIFQEFIETGESKIREDLREQEFNEKYAGYSEEEKTKVKALLNEEADIELVLINIEENKETFFQLDEESIISLLPIMEGNINLLDYQISTDKIN